MEGLTCRLTNRHYRQHPSFAFFDRQTGVTKYSGGSGRLALGGPVAVPGIGLIQSDQGYDRLGTLFVPTNPWTFEPVGQRLTNGLRRPAADLPLLGRKPQSLAFAKPFDGWRLRRCFDVLRNRMEVELDPWIREYIQMLRPLEARSVQDLTAAVEKALRHHVHTKDALTQSLPDGPPWRQTTFALAGQPHPRLVQIWTADHRAYGCLFG